MTLIRSLLFTLLFYPGTLVYVLGVIIFSPFGDLTFPMPSEDLPYTHPVTVVNK